MPTKKRRQLLQTMLRPTSEAATAVDVDNVFPEQMMLEAPMLKAPMLEAPGLNNYFSTLSSTHALENVSSAGVKRKRSGGLPRSNTSLSLSADAIFLAEQAFNKITPVLSTSRMALALLSIRSKMAMPYSGGDQINPTQGQAGQAKGKPVGSGPHVIPPGE
jgi:hypothetical protein